MNGYNNYMDGWTKKFDRELSEKMTPIQPAVNGQRTQWFNRVTRGNEAETDERH